MAETPQSLADTGAVPEKGSWYQLLADFGEGVGMLTRTHRYRPAGEEDVQESDRQLLALDIVAPATAGVGYSAEETVLCLWLESAGPGRLAMHHISFPRSQFVELVGAGEEPPQWAAWQAQQAGGS
ncbi:hypothetical protein [Actinacidiphila glaucinigra]|uniref:hypothetical protein n=1 Tax=Actinacidiphila glaucinigra TaxID=235986 RepID=UPI00366D6DF4